LAVERPNHGIELLGRERGGAGEHGLGARLDQGSEPLDVIVVPVRREDEVDTTRRVAAERAKVVEGCGGGRAGRLAAVDGEPMVATEVDQGALAKTRPEQRELELIGGGRRRPVIPT